MNFIGRMEDPEVRVELKYCERCGGLFLRRPAEDRVLCAACALHLAQQTDTEPIPGKASLRKPPSRRRTRKKRPDAGELGNTGHIGCLQGVAEVGVWA